MTITKDKTPSFVFLSSRYILQLAQKQQRPRCPNCKMYLETIGADEGAFNTGCCFASHLWQSCLRSKKHESEYDLQVLEIRSIHSLCP